jgi:hypothetical protein
MPGFAGTQCEHSDQVTCNGGGIAQADGSCACLPGYAGVHCEHSDTGTCQACAAAKTGVANGTCANVEDGLDPRGSCPAGSCTGAPGADAATLRVCDGAGACRAVTRACAPFLCDAAGLACRTTCTVDTDCTAGAFCAGGVCKTRRPDGAACTKPEQCLSASCVDGVCCDVPCAGRCQACTAAKKGGGVDGNCGFVADGADPEAECGGPLCKDDRAEGTHVCDGKGACRAVSTTACTPFACDASGTACRGSCSADADCASGYRCDAGACVRGDVDGTPCAASRQCASKHCVDGVCCDRACDGACEACSARERGAGADGVCGPVTQGACAISSDAGVAEAAPVDASTPPTASGPVVRCEKGSDCQTGFCVDGICCDSPCSQRCYSCGLASSLGHCVAEPAGVDLRAECAPSRSCLGTCDGKGGCIAAGPGTQCLAPRCVSASTGVGAAYCTEPGAPCPSGAEVEFDCGAYLCVSTPGAAACLDRCTTSDMCAPGFTCDTSTQKCVTLGGGEGDSTSCAIGGAGRARRGGGLAAALLVGAVIAWARRRRARGLLVTGAITSAVAGALGCADRTSSTVSPIDAGQVGDATGGPKSAGAIPEAERATQGVFVRRGEALEARAPRGGLWASFGRLGVDLAAGEVARCRLALAKVDGLDALASPPPSPRVRAAREEIAYERGGGVTEWNALEGRGIEQGFTVAAPLSGGRLRLELAIAGALRPVARRGGVDLVAPSGARVLALGELWARDADDRVLPARIDVAHGRVVLAIDARAARYPVTIDPIVWALQASLAAPTGVVGDRLGGSVALDGGRAVLGAPNHARAGVGDEGLAYVLDSATSGFAWSATLIGDPGASARFGASVAVKGDTAAIGAPGADGQGAVYVFTKGSAAWSLEAKLVAGDGAAGDELGAAIALDADTLIAGARGSAGGKGAVYVFTRAGTAWSIQAKMIAPDAAPGDALGDAVAIDGDSAVVGASGKGAAYVFTRSTGRWTQRASLTAASVKLGERFGAAVAIRGDTIVVGAPGHRVGANDGQGGAFVFAGGGATWQEQPELIVATGAAADVFGSSVALASTRLLVGAPGARYGALAQGVVRSYARVGTGPWTLDVDPLVAADGQAGDALGAAVAIGDRSALVGAPKRGAGLGGAYAFLLGADLGDACSLDGDCASAHCVDGVCCDTPCAGRCVACTAAKKGGGSDGNCGAARDGSDPDGDCAGASCAKGALATTRTCDGLGACRAASAITECAPFACASATACATTCTSDDDCADAAYCDGSKCVTARALGEPCAAPRQCASMSCADGVCCDRACDGACEACSAAEKGFGVDGICAPSGAPACGDAGAPTTIDGAIDAGASERPIVSGKFQRCAVGSDCATGFCVDGVCCDTECRAPCHSCALPSSPGVCALEPVGVDLRTECGPTHGCLGTCDGKGACTGAVAGAQCEPSRCLGGSAGRGPAACTAPGVACPVERAVDFDCAPYICEPAFGRCRDGCTQSTDCASGFVCDVLPGKCVAVESSSGDSGCAHAGPRARSTLAGAIVLAGLVAATRRRRAARRR